MNILYINHYAGSPEMGMEFRPYYLAREWVKMGHTVTIVAGNFSHLRRVNPVVTRDFQTEMIDGITYCWLKTGRYNGNGAARAISMFYFVSKLLLNAKKIANEYAPDVVIASSTYPLDTFAAQKISRLSCAVYVHEVHDMWPITLVELGGMSRYHPFVVLMQMAENSFCKHADLVVSLPVAACDYFAKHGLNPDNFCPITNGVVEEEWENPEPLDESLQGLLNDFIADKELTICFFGSHTKSYALEYIIEAVANASQNIGMIFVGDGNQKRELIVKANSLNKNRFLFVSQIRKEMVPTLLEQVGCIYIGALRNDMFRFGICMNKLFDSMMSGRPILYAVEAPNNYINDYQCGITVEPESTAALCQGINQILSMTEVELDAMGENGRNAVLENYSYNKLAQIFINAIQDRSHITPNT